MTFLNEEEKQIEELKEFLKDNPDLLEVLHAGLKIGACLGYRCRMQGLTLGQMIEGLEENHPTPNFDKKRSPQ